MIRRTISRSLPLLLFTALLSQPPRLLAQQPGGDAASFRRFAGVWKGVCADGKDFVVLTLRPSGADLSGTVSIANMHGEDGQCATVIEPPTEEHAMKVSGVRLRGDVLAFQGSANAGFEMTTTGSDGARLKFLGTPVEDKPWELKRVR
jgi:hypothetical protein